jgi:hypothetical protein
MNTMVLNNKKKQTLVFYDKIWDLTAFVVPLTMF